MNKAILVGNLTRDPELKTTPSGVSVCTFTIAVNRRFTSADGERHADFIPIVVWRVQAENCGKYLKKGSKVAVCGMIQTRSYEANDGGKRYVTEIVADEVQFLDNAGSSGGNKFGEPPPQLPSNEDSFSEFTSIEDDDLPF